MSGEWGKEREAQHRAKYPPAEKGERNRTAQARYRKYHAKQIAAARRLANILLHHDTAMAARALRGFFSEDEVRGLCKLLRSPRQNARRTKL
jgi:hypothetical protein